MTTKRLCDKIVKTKPKIKSSTFVKSYTRELQAVELQYTRRKEWTYEGERTQSQALSVAIDGYRARNSAKRMIVRKKWTYNSQFGWHRGIII